MTDAEIHHGGKTVPGATVPAFAGHTQVTRFETASLTMHSKKSYFEVTAEIENDLPQLSTPKLFEYVGRVSRPFSIFWELEQGTAMRLAGIPVESKFYNCPQPSSAASPR
jgi:hypothetical protein